MSEKPPSPASVEPEVHFCDLCQESVPDLDVREARALSFAGRLICQRCRRRLVPPLPGVWLASLLGLLATVAGLLACLLVRQTGHEVDRLATLVGALPAKLDALSRQAGEGRLEAERGLAGVQEAMAGALREAGGEAARERQELAGEFRLLAARLAGVGEEEGRNLAALAERVSALEGASRQQGELLVRIASGIAALASRPAPAAPAAPAGPGPAAPQVPAGPDLAALEALRGELGSAEADQRWRALEKLEKVGGPEAAKLVAGRLEDGDVWVRRLAAEVLGKIGGDENLEALIAALGDSEAMVRATAHASLRRLSGQEIGFDPYAGAAERRRSQERWREWWAGRARGKAGG